MITRAALIEVLTKMTEREARDLVTAVGQWADNQRNFVEESDPAELDKSNVAQLRVAEKFVEAGETALILWVEARTAARTEMVQL